MKKYGKLHCTTIDQKIISRLSVLVSGQDMIELLSVSKIQDVSMQFMVKAVSGIMDE